MSPADGHHSGGAPKTMAILSNPVKVPSWGCLRDDLVELHAAAIAAADPALAVTRALSLEGQALRA